MPIVEERIQWNPEKLTLGQCTKLIGGTIGTLLGMAPEQTVESAVRWWLENWDKAAKPIDALLKIAEKGSTGLEKPQ